MNIFLIYFNRRTAAGEKFSQSEELYMASTTKQDYALRRKEQLSIYKLSLKWLDKTPKTSMEMIRSKEEKTPSYYKTARQIIRAIEKQEIDPKAVKVVYVSRSPGFVQLPFEDGGVRYIPENETDFDKYESEINPYFTTIEREGLIKWAISKNYNPHFLKDDIESFKKIVQISKIELPYKNWEDIAVTMKDFKIIIRVGKKRQELNFKKAGFEDKRKKKVPILLWTLLTTFAINNGVLDLKKTDLNRKYRKNLKQHISRLRKRLQFLFELQSNPIEYTGDGYRTLFQITTKEEKRGFSAPFNVDSWNKLTFEEKQDCILVSCVETDEYTFWKKTENQADKQPIDASRNSDKEIKYKLSQLGLADSDEHPYEIGKAFLELLRSDGKLFRPLRDRIMIKLSQVLLDFFDIEEFPFDVDEETGTWSAKFQVESFGEIAPSTR